ncbi:MAG: transglycosylase domain-containing protein [Desulfocapsaceae bacterium]|nr:transglycosylase domain-containing protein [Desulfocapsaceae bacterium]
MKNFFYFLLTTGLLACAGGAVVFYWLVVLHPGQEIDQDNIHRILGIESPVLYSDGETRLGVFFDEAHRQYIPFNRIPKDFVNALVASEDEKFFSHFGFDPLGIIRAAINNLLAGRTVQGGSTLTQQTAKNLFKRTDRSLTAKLKELVFALRLEHRYSKEKIFEFYANQFFVSGNAVGLGVAARYYFNKLPEELTLVECAFIAGSVKRPNFYNPFVQKNDLAAETARKRAKARTGYVLDRMFDLGMITKEQVDAAKSQEIDFDKGKVGYSLDYVMELVREAVSTTEVLDALAAHDITNLATSGVRIITTVDKNLQGKTLSALRHELSQLDVRLRGYDRDEVQTELKKIDYDGDATLQEGAFLPGVITKVTPGNFPSVEVSLDGKLGNGIIDREGLKNLAVALGKRPRQPSADASNREYAALLGQLKEQDRVWVSVRLLEPEGKILLNLERYPEVEGGALVLQDGRIKAVAGGVENRFFNRAIYAKRTMGSSFKPFVFTAALQLGWNAADALSNVRDIFVYQNQSYFPRPDHISPYDSVSMSWAGVESENIAAVWLTYHLCDKLNEAQFKEVAAHVGLAPRVSASGETESYNSYKARIRDTYGILIDDKALAAAAYNSAIANSETDFIFDNKLDEYKLLKKLYYGQGLEGVREQTGDGDSDGADSGRQEMGLREKAVSGGFLSLQSLKKELDAYRKGIEGNLFDPGSGSGLSDEPLAFDAEPPRGVLCYDSFQDRYSYERRSELPGNMVPVSRAHLQELLLGMDQAGRKGFWDKVFIKSTVSLAGFEILENQINLEFARLRQLPAYNLDVLSSVRDFRILVGLEYLVELGRQMGIRSKMDPVLSFPLGSNVVTLLEATRMYEGMVTGAVSIYGEQGQENGDVLAVIDRIESATGEVLYRPKKTTTHPVAPQTSLAVGHILENVVKYGTGRYADKNVRMIGKDGKTLNIPVPLLGKTGTANNYTNASFLGYLPGPVEQAGAMPIGGGFAVGAYVGYDDNKPMKQGALRVTGAVGALPTWTEVVNTILWEEGYGQRLNQADIPRTGLMVKRDDLQQVNVAVRTENGGLPARPVYFVDEHDRYKPSIMTFAAFDETGDMEPAREFKPFWKTTPQENPEAIQQ